MGSTYSLPTVCRIFSIFYSYRNRERDFLGYFIKEDEFVFFNDFQG